VFSLAGRLECCTLLEGGRFGWGSEDPSYVTELCRVPEGVL
jgi:hypothetical protein